MLSKNTPIKLILGIKLRQYRIDKGWTLKELANQTKISHSYLNEIEKGKKYPKPDKLLTISEALEIPFDNLVSTSFAADLKPIERFFRSNFFNEFPFEFFEIEYTQLIQAILSSPQKLSTLLNTLNKLSENYNIDFHRLYTNVLFSYIEIHKNNFPEIEEKASALKLEKTESAIKKHLRVNYNADIELFNPERNPALKSIRTVYLPKQKKLLINRELKHNQRLFYNAKELGYKVLTLKSGFLTSPNIHKKSFVHYLNDYLASYFASSFLIPEGELMDKLEPFFSRKTFLAAEFFKIADYFNVNMETFLYRLITVLNKSMGIEDLYFLKFESLAGTREAKILKEIRISETHSHNINYLEHHCRRWLALNKLNESYIENNLKAQVIQFVDDGKKYFEISTLQKQISGKNETLTLCIAIDDHSKNRINLFGDSKIKNVKVGNSCETCQIFDCKERVAAPSALTKQRNIQELEKAIKNL